MDMKTTPYYAIFADVYGLLSRYMPVRTDNAYWDALIQESDQLYRKYNQTDDQGNQYARKLIYETLEELGRISNDLERKEKAAAGIVEK